MPPHDDKHLDGADIRGFYTALGIHLPDWANAEAAVRCFADPDAHRRGDRKPSCSVNLASGAWNCHGCDASGGAYDAAIHTGHTSRSAIDLMIFHGLTQRRAPASRQHQHPINRGAYVCRRVNRPAPAAARFTVTESDIKRWRHALDSETAIVERLIRERGWQLKTMWELELGVDRGRITIPVRDHRRRLVGLLRYRPRARHGQLKMRAAVGSRRQLLPHPAIEPSTTVVLVEGEPDMIAARSHGLPAIAVPGVESWQPESAELFGGRHVTIVADSDRQGRALAARIAAGLANDAELRIVDPAPDRDDGYDLTDWLLAEPLTALEALR